MGCSFIAPIQSAIGQVANVVAPIAAAIPGPWQLPAIAYNVYNAAQQGNVLGAVMAAIPGVGVVGQAGGIANAVSNSYNGLAGIANGISSGAGIASSIGNAAGSAYNYASEAAALQAVQPGLSAAEASALAQAGVAPSGIQGAALADVQSGAQGLIGQGVGANGLYGASGAAGQTAQSAGGTTGSLLGSLAQGAASVYGAQQVAKSAQNAAAINQAATQGALQLQATQFNQAQANQQPWLTAGQGALTAQQDLMGLGVNGSAGQLAALKSSPGYQFQLDQGNTALTNGLAARGGMGSGAAATAASKYFQYYPKTAYNNRLAQLSGLSATGQNTAVGMAAQGANYANTASNTSIAGANTQANAGLVGAQANQSGLMGAANAAMNYLNPTQSTLGLYR